MAIFTKNRSLKYYKYLTVRLHHYPFGSPMPGRQFNSNSYKYCFNGKEKDDEGLGGGGSTYDYGFRIYNPNIGKFLSVDPLIKEYPELTPYQFASNRPICAIDRDGLEAEDVGAGIDVLIITTQGIGQAQGGEPSEGKTQTKNAAAENYNNGTDKMGLGRIEETYSHVPKTKALTYASTHNPRTTASDIAATIVNFKKNNPSGKVILVGHSAGGVNELIALQTKDITCVDLVIVIDASYAENMFDYANGRGKASNIIIGDNADVLINFHNAQPDGISGAILKLDKVGKGANIPIENTKHEKIDNKVLPMVRAIIEVYLKTGVVPFEQIKDFDYSKLPSQPNTAPEEPK